MSNKLNWDRFEFDYEDGSRITGKIAVTDRLVIIETDDRNGNRRNSKSCKDKAQKNRASDALRQAQG